MQFIYSLLLALAFVALSPYFIYQALRRRKYLNNFRERMGSLPEFIKSDARPAIWLHAVSVGEALAAGSLVKELGARFPHHRLIISTTTATGQAVARERLSGADGYCYFPFDWKFCVRRALNSIRPQVVILMESELWLNFLSECSRRAIPVLVANGRISDRSYVRSLKFGFFVRRLYELVSEFAMQSQVDADRAARLGANLEHIIVSGNIKYDVGESAGSRNGENTANSLESVFALGSAPLVIAGSTSQGEEEIIITAFKRLRNEAGLQPTRLLIAPRHPERFGEVASLLDSLQVRYVRRSAVESAGTAQSRAADCILLDSVGELAALYRFAAAVFVGGSMVRKGGHNILEPALYAKPIIVGPHMENFREIRNEFLRRDALIQLRETGEMADELKGALYELLTNQEWARRIGENARKAVEENRGATARTLELVVELLGGDSPQKTQKDKRHKKEDGIYSL
jgi:3-deoxy-D-manno-octulosonic-acid transferase